MFRALRKRALDGEAKKAAWFEFSVPEIGDVKDPARWAATNPALGRRIQFSTIEGEAEQLDPGHLSPGNGLAGGARRSRNIWTTPSTAPHGKPAPARTKSPKAKLLTASSFPPMAAPCACAAR